MKNKDWIMLGIVVAFAALSLYAGLSPGPQPAQAYNGLGYLNNTTVNQGRDYAQYALRGR